ncbi:lysylphosphatidylglycerol synthase domain-containing protein [Rhizobium tropici]|uniref:Flippase-like domain-containing protein n=1 Tax=Rhizobium tropici TaxID=398 RepID=A0A329YFL0_RHITR|nr:lysylphosphatidylglycerol synthase domain-containing protein [Rhizobium tropici]RAX41983.1 hypothetical protein DQ393_10405 [Rhizobium tropici]
MKPVVRIVGVIVSLAAFAFVGRTIYRSLDSLQQQLASPLFLFAVAGSVFVYAMILQLCGLAWHRLLTAIDDPPFGIGRALAIYGKTQIYKYLPSNVLHMIGRYRLARSAGASNKALAFAQIAELLTILLAAAGISALLARAVLVHALKERGIDAPTFVNVLVVGGIAVLAVGATAIVRQRIAGTGRKALAAAAVAFAIYALFFIGSGLLLAALCKSLSTAGGVSELVGIGAAAWLVGFVVPGAPGGLGVRETILIAGLSAAGLPTAEATAVALGYRFVTTVGDALVATVIMLLEFEK